jgi:hypothetical protein
VEKAVFAPPRKYLTAARLPSSDLGLQARELADVDREEDIHSASERLAKLIVARRRRQGCDELDKRSRCSKNGKGGEFWRHCDAKRDSPKGTFFFPQSVAEARLVSSPKLKATPSH